MENRTIKPKLLFWTYLFQITIVSILLFIWSVVVVSDIVPHHMGTAFGRDSWLRIVLPLVFAALSIVSGIAMSLYHRRNLLWVNWTIGGGIVYTAFFIHMASRIPLSVFSILDLYIILIISLNLTYIVLLLRFKSKATKYDTAVS